MTDTDTDTTDDYWSTERVVREMQADNPDLDADDIERVLHDMEAEGLVRHDPGKGWYLPSVARAMAFLATHDASLAADTATDKLRARARDFAGGGDRDR